MRRSSTTTFLSIFLSLSTFLSINLSDFIQRLAKKNDYFRDAKRVKKHPITTLPTATFVFITSLTPKFRAQSRKTPRRLSTTQNEQPLKDEFARTMAFHKRTDDVTVESSHRKPPRYDQWVII